MAEDLLQQLSGEILSIIRAPYIPSLKSLQHLLLERADSRTIQTWVDQNPCQTLPLTAILINNARIFPYALDILHKLSYSPAFRTGLVSFQPSFLDTLLRTTLESEEGFQKHAPFCIRLLSGPLPDNVPLPAAAEAFVLKVITLASANLTRSSALEVASLLQGSGRDAIDALPDRVLFDLGEQIKDVIHAFAQFTDCKTLCFGILAIVAERRRSKASSRSFPSTSESSSSANSVEQQPLCDLYETLFKQKYVSKTVESILGGVLALYRNDSDDGEKVKVAMAANEAMDAVEEPQRIAHAGQGRSLNIVGRLIEKSLVETFPIGLQLEVIRLLGAVVEISKLPQVLVDRVESFVRRLTIAEHHEYFEETTLQNIIGHFAPRFSAALLRDLLQLSLDSYAQDTNAQGSRSIRNQSLVLRTLEDVVEESSNVRTQLLRSIVMNDMSASLAAFRQKTWDYGAMDMRCPPSGACPSHHVADRVRLGSQICSLMLSAALSGLGDELGMDLSLSRLLRNKLRELTLFLGRRQQQPQFQEVATPTFKLRYKQEGQYDIQSSDWQSRMVSNMQGEDVKRQRAIVSNVEELCRELEERCQHAEKPFREEQGKRLRAEKKYESVKAHVVRLRDQLVEVSQNGKLLNEEKINLSREIYELTRENEDMLSKIEKLEGKLIRTQQEAKERLEAEREDQVQRNFEKDALLAVKQEKINRLTTAVEELRSQLASSMSKVTELEKQVLLVGEEKTTATRELRIAKDDCEKQGQALLEARELNIAKISNLEAQIASKAADLEVARTDLGQAESNIQDLQREVTEKATELRTTSEQLDAARISIAHAQEKSAQDLHSLKAQHQVEVDELKREARSNETQLREAIARLEQEQIEKDATIEELEDLNADLERQNKVLSEKEQHLNQINAMMASFGAGRPDLPDTGNEYCGPALPRPAQQRPALLRREQQGTSNGGPLIYGLHARQPARSIRTVSVSPLKERTPKKPRRSEVKKSTVFSTATESTKLPQSGRSLTRLPLDDVSPIRSNRSPRRRATTLPKINIPGMQEEKERIVGETEEGFGGSSLFTRSMLANFGADGASLEEE